MAARLDLLPFVVAKRLMVDHVVTNVIYVNLRYNDSNVSTHQHNRYRDTATLTVLPACCAQRSDAVTHRLASPDV